MRRTHRTKSKMILKVDFGKYIWKRSKRAEARINLNLYTCNIIEIIFVLIWCARIKSRNSTRDVECGTWQWPRMAQLAQGEHPRVSNWCSQNTAPKVGIETASVPKKKKDRREHIFNRSNFANGIIIIYKPQKNYKLKRRSDYWTKSLRRNSYTLSYQRDIRNFKLCPKPFHTHLKSIAILGSLGSSLGCRPHHQSLFQTHTSYFITKPDLGSCRHMAHRDSPTNTSSDESDSRSSSYTSPEDGSDTPSRDLSPPNLIGATSFLTVGQTFSGSRIVHCSPRDRLPSSRPHFSGPLAFAPDANTVAVPTHTAPILTAGTSTIPDADMVTAAVPAQSTPRPNDDWNDGKLRVNVTIRSVNLNEGTVCGTMETLVLPRTTSPVVTFWTGEIIDNINHFFEPGHWGAHARHGIEHWILFNSFVILLRSRCTSGSVNDTDLSKSRYIFIRWKEFFFDGPTGEQHGRSIAGFYYVCMDRHTGAITGNYLNRNGQPFQKLCLLPVSNGNGFAFADYDLNWSDIAESAELWGP